MPPRPFLLSCALCFLLVACGQGEATLTPTLEPTVAATATLAPLVATEEATKTPRPTIAPTEAIPTSAGNECRPVEQITVALVGQELCVTGVVRSLKHTDEAFFINFENTTTFYWLTYDIPRIYVEPGDCVEMTGPVVLLVGDPVMVIHWADKPMECGTGRNLLNSP